MTAGLAKTSILLVASAVSVLLTAGCSQESETEVVTTSTSAAAGETASAASKLGPVQATVRLTPKAPKLGDTMLLELDVLADKGVEVEMPEYGEVLRRFQIEDNGQDRTITDKQQRFVQKYFLSASSSGRLRIPPLRVVFHDRRETSEMGDQEQELLTEELSVKVEPILTLAGAAEAELSGLRPSLDTDLGSSPLARYWWMAALGALGIVGMGTLFFIRRSRTEESVSPYERASVALAELEGQGIPEGDMLDPWYVELSSIVRRYLEDQFGLRAPELTTEEFLREAQRSVLLRDDHKSLLQGFLADCDRVKFAGYQPNTDESQALLAAARRFLLETRSNDEDQQASPGAGQVAKAVATSNAPPKATADDNTEAEQRNKEAS